MKISHVSATIQSISTLGLFLLALITAIKSGDIIVKIAQLEAKQIAQLKAEQIAQLEDDQKEMVLGQALAEARYLQKRGIYVYVDAL